MADKISAAARSQNMAAIKSKDTTPELYIRKGLYKLGYRYRKNYAGIIGSPDIWLGKYNTAIFIHGCFWHRHKNCKYAYTPKSRKDFWLTKFERNVARDEEVFLQLKQQGIKTLIIWECTVKEMQHSKDAENSCFDRIEAFLNTKESYLEI